MDITYGIIIN